MTMVPALRMSILAILGASWVSVPPCIGQTTPPVPKQHDGLSANLFVTPATVKMGDKVEFRIELSFDSTSASYKTRLLNRYSEHLEFVFRNKATGAKFSRTPSQGGEPDYFQLPERAMALTGPKRLSLDGIWINLLSEQGEHIPPGTYVVTAQYENKGERGVEAFKVSTTSVEAAKPYTGPWEFWKGSVETSPVVLNVLPAEPKGVSVSVPTQLLLDTTSRPGQFGWACSEDSTTSGPLPAACT